MKRSNLSILFGAGTALLVLIAYFGTTLYCKPVTPGDSPTVISWDLTFLFPLLALSALCTLCTFGFLVAYLVSSERKTAFRLALPILLALSWYIPLLLSRRAEADFIRQTKKSSDPIEIAISHRADGSNLEGYQCVQMPPDTAATKVVDRLIRLSEPQIKKYRIVQTRVINIFDPTSKKSELYQAVAIDSDQSARRVFLMCYDDRLRIWNVEIYYSH